MDFEDIILNEKEETKGTIINHVIFVMDHSGSMLNRSIQALEGLNGNIDELRKSENQETFITLINFNHDVSVEFERVPIEDVKEITEYEARGYTALLDAIGKATEIITEDPWLYDKKLNYESLIIIISDGFENNSKTYTSDKIKSLMKELEVEKGKAIFTFIGCDKSFLEKEIIGTLGFNIGNTLHYTDTEKGYRDSSEIIKRTLRAYYLSRGEHGDSSEIIKQSLRAHHLSGGEHDKATSSSSSSSSSSSIKTNK